mgnify:CR=1 FL=1
MDTTHLLYLHGFRSSPLSFKAQRMQAVLRERHPGVTWWCPQLPPSPRAAMALVEQGIAGWPRERMAVVGSSLGGFYATWVAERTGCRAVLLNPAVHAARDLARHIGEQTAHQQGGDGALPRLRQDHGHASPHQFRRSVAARPGRSQLF